MVSSCIKNIGKLIVVLLILVNSAIRVKAGVSQIVENGIMLEDSVYYINMNGESLKDFIDSDGLWSSRDILSEDSDGKHKLYISGTGTLNIGVVLDEITLDGSRDSSSDLCCNLLIWKDEGGIVYNNEIYGTEVYVDTLDVQEGDYYYRVQKWGTGKNCKVKMYFGLESNVDNSYEEGSWYEEVDIDNILTLDELGAVTSVVTQDTDKFILRVKENGYMFIDLFGGNEDTELRIYKDGGFKDKVFNSHTLNGDIQKVYLRSGTYYGCFMNDGSVCRASLGFLPCSTRISVKSMKKNKNGLTIVKFKYNKKECKEIRVIKGDVNDPASDIWSKDGKVIKNGMFKTNKRGSYTARLDDGVDDCYCIAQFKV